MLHRLNAARNNCRRSQHEYNEPLFTFEREADKCFQEVGPPPSLSTLIPRIDSLIFPSSSSQWSHTIRLILTEKREQGEVLLGQKSFWLLFPSISPACTTALQRGKGLRYRKKLFPPPLFLLILRSCSQEEGSEATTTVISPPCFVPSGISLAFGGGVSFPPAYTSVGGREIRQLKFKNLLKCKNRTARFCVGDF